MKKPFLLQFEKEKMRRLGRNVSNAVWVDKEADGTMAYIPSRLVVMLTYQDKTVANALEVFETCAGAKAQFWGFKEAGLPLAEMAALTQRMKQAGKTVFLEVVSYTEQEGLKGAQAAAFCGCDVVMGTMFSEKIADFCKENKLRYMPFVGDVRERPSVLYGSAEQMLQQAKRALEYGVDGFDLLGYRYVGDAVALNNAFVKGVQAPVCLAGGINSFERLEQVKRTNPWAFTIGSAFFEHRFGDSFEEQINAVCDFCAQAPGNQTYIKR